MNLMKNTLIKGTIFISSSQTISSLLGFLTTIILIRMLGTSEYGLFVLVISSISISTSFLDLGLKEVVSADMANEIGRGRDDKAKKMFRDFYRMQIIIGVFLSVLVFLVSFLAMNFYTHPVVSNLIFIGTSLIFLNAIRNIFFVAFYSHSKFGNYSFIQLLDNFIRLVGIVIFIGIFKEGILMVMVIYISSTLLTLLLLTPPLFKTIQQFRNITHSETHELKKMIQHHGKYNIFSAPLKTISSNLPYWIINFVMGVEFVAIYSIAFKIFSFFNSLVSSVSIVLVPIISKQISNNVKWVKHLILRSTKGLVYLALPITIVTMITAPFMFKLFFNQDYSDAVFVFRIFLPILIFNSMFLSATRPLFYALQLQKGLFMSILLLVFLIVTLGFPLTIWFGVKGMALAYVLSLVISILFQYGYVKSKVSILFDFKELVRLDKYDRSILKNIFGGQKDES